MNFKNIFLGLPKLTQQFITKKQAYLARSDDRIVIKVSKKQIIVLNDNGSWEIFDSMEKFRDRLKCEQADREPMGGDIFGGDYFAEMEHDMARQISWDNINKNEAMAWAVMYKNKDVTLEETEESLTEEQFAIFLEITGIQ